MCNNWILCLWKLDLWLSDILFLLLRFDSLRLVESIKQISIWASDSCIVFLATAIVGMFNVLSLATASARAWVKRKQNAKIPQKTKGLQCFCSIKFLASWIVIGLDETRQNELSDSRCLHPSSRYLFVQTSIREIRLLGFGIALYEDELFMMSWISHRWSTCDIN